MEKEKKHNMRKIVFDNGNIWQPKRLVEIAQGSSTSTDNKGKTETYVAIYDRIEAEIIYPANDQKEQPERKEEKNTERITILKCQHEANQKKWSRHSTIKGNEQIQLLKNATKECLPEESLMKEIIAGNANNKKEKTPETAIKEAIAIALRGNE